MHQAPQMLGAGNREASGQPISVSQKINEKHLRLSITFLLPATQTWGPKKGRGVAERKADGIFEEQTRPPSSLQVFPALSQISNRKEYTLKGIRE